MPLPPTRLVSNICFVYIRKKAWESYIFARPDTSLGCLQVTNERVRASLKALVNAYSNIYVHQASLSVRFPFRHCKEKQNLAISA